jgi:hypothetical protein
MKVAYITAIYGSYESSCKPYVKQTIDSDFICFTDNPKLPLNGWSIDTLPYHFMIPSPLDNGLYVNSMFKKGKLGILSNLHPFNIAKYYKQQWHLIPRLTEYDVVIWMDGTLEILSPNISEYALEICPKYELMTWHHELRGGLLFNEAYTSFIPKYTNTDFNGYKQPYQDVIGQYHDYLQEGYDETYWKGKYNRVEGRGRGDHFGVWATGFLAFNNRSDFIPKFLDHWYLQTLKYTTQDQVGFPKAAQDFKWAPYTLPDKIFSGIEAHVENSMFKVHSHGK